MVGRGELTDQAWSSVEPLLPTSRRRGGQWRDHRTVINGILWKLRTGAPWRDLPERYGPWQMCADRLYCWRRDGTWDRILAHVQTKADQVGCSRRGGLGSQHRQFDRASTSPCERRTATAQSG